MTKAAIIWFERVSRGDVHCVGGENASLGETVGHPDACALHAPAKENAT